MTAVAPPPNFQNISRQGWSGQNGVSNGAAPMSGDDYRQIFMPPRKTVQRANSSSSLASTSSSNTVIAPSSSQPNGAPADASTGASYRSTKKIPRGLWPATKTEPVSGISTARPQSIASASSGPSAASAMTALHTPAPMLPSQHGGATPAAQNQSNAPRAQGPENNAILHLIPLNATFEPKAITVPFYPDVLRIGRQTNNKTLPTPQNGYFDSKVLSRQHAEIWAERNGKIWIRDVKSSNGTFVNNQRLSPENRDSDPHELREQDILELGIDIVSEDQKTIVHHKVKARVEHAGIYANTGGNIMELSFGELENPQMSPIGQGGQQQLPNMRGRAPGQGPVNGGRLQGAPGAMGNTAGGMQQPRQPNFWLQPVTMDQIVKKLNTEMKAARQQSQELQQTHQYINNILSAEPKKESKPSSIRVSPIKDQQLRFSEPPAPPPQQPLPEKPDAPSLRRTDTERPSLNGSPVRPDSKISTLADALTSAKKEIEAQSVRVQSLEALLNEERRAREDAEERANRLEQQSLKDRDQPESVQVDGVSGTNVDSHPSESVPDQEQGEDATSQNGSASPTGADAATARLQQRLELMMSEMNEMKQQMEKYRQRAEDAEAENLTNRKTLAEMVEKIRENDAKNANKAAKRRSRRNSALSQSSSDPVVADGSEEFENAEEGDITIINEDADNNVPEGLKQRVQNGHAIGQDAAADLAKAAHALTTRQTNRSGMTLASGAPAASMLVVVALGVAVMTWLNNYPKVER